MLSRVRCNLIQISQMITFSKKHAGNLGSTIFNETLTPIYETDSKTSRRDEFRKIFIKCTANTLKFEQLASPKKSIQVPRLAAHHFLEAGNGCTRVEYFPQLLRRILCSS